MSTEAGASEVPAPSPESDPCRDCLVDADPDTHDCADSCGYADPCPDCDCHTDFDAFGDPIGPINAGAYSSGPIGDPIAYARSDNVHPLPRPDGERQ